MRMSRGVEWAMHVVLSLAWVDDDRPVSTAVLARSYDLPAPYLNKQLQALVRAGILTSVPGAAGGFVLTRSAKHISVLDVVTAIEGAEEAFRCTEIRAQGVGADMPPGQLSMPCAVSMAMRKADLAWRRELAGQSVDDVRVEAERHAPGLAERMRQAYDRG
ncbi:Rrf2 family transcriptional regulator [Rhodococcus sp. ACS1]|uniref:Rrf2 family protein n=1 Tax=Rhodococcus koreensis TaxID=99653 RepID=A0A1H4X1A3_9NOCA|nr:MULTISPECIES: Rrf2 family transcriptional regulator [Rhodococcus]PBC47862.1 Rrf2 family transcriptional regulator [Rhodococcus sp. ACS1]QSE80490.1 Rrf2 family transcriptional regulator [Rhodococcus koreensis]SEC99030.1 Rrf2 family protein [Rhodococcus koreensis]